MRPWIKSLMSRVSKFARPAAKNSGQKNAHEERFSAINMRSELSQEGSASASVFASYSRKDARLVVQLLGLLRAIDVSIFRDEQSIKPGRKWRVEINVALEHCQTILVFWCRHAAQSSEVRSEYERAISLGKRVVPVLIDSTALPSDLGQYQGVDLRMTFRENHDLLIDALEERIRDQTTLGYVREIDLERWKQAQKENKLRFEAADRIIASAHQQLVSSLDSIM